MRAYKIVPFNCGSKGLNALVAKVQRMPGHSITAKMASGGAPQAAVADRCLVAIARVMKVSPNSPGGAYKPQALKIVWGVYAWIQGWKMANPVVSRNYTGPNVVSLQALQEVGEI